MDCFFVFPVALPEQVLVADGDGGEFDVFRVDDFDVDGLWMTSKKEQTIRHEPNEETEGTEHQQQPHEPTQTHTHTHRRPTEQRKKD